MSASRLKYNTEFIKKEVKDGMALKVPVFCAVIRTIDITSGLDMSCEFMDDKGEICGVFHRYAFLNCPASDNSCAAVLLQIFQLNFFFNPENFSIEYSIYNLQSKKLSLK